MLGAILLVRLVAVWPFAAGPLREWLGGPAIRNIDIWPLKAATVRMWLAVPALRDVLFVATLLVIKMILRQKAVSEGLRGFSRRAILAVLAAAALAPLPLFVMVSMGTGFWHWFHSGGWILVVTVVYTLVLVFAESIDPDIRRKWINRGAMYAVLTIGALGMMFPVFWMFLNSVKKTDYSAGKNMVWFPAPWERKYFTTDHYNELMSRTGAKSSGGADNFIECSMNTFIYTALGTFSVLLICSMAGYALAKRKFRGAKVILFSILATMMIPGIMVLLPDFVTTNFVLHAYDTFAGLVIPTLASSFGVFLMRQYMLSVPDELIEAARVDGAGEARTFFTIVMPLVTPILVAYGILCVLGYWNDLLWPMVITKDLKVLQVALLNLTEIGSQRMGPVMAGAAISSTPVIILFMLVRKQFVQAMTSGALKG